MSRTFGQDGSGDRVFTTGTPVSAYPLTVLAWYKPATQEFATNGRSVIGFADSASSQYLYSVGLAPTGEVSLVSRFSSYYTNNGSRKVTAGEWHALAGVWRGDTDRNGYLAKYGDTTIDASTGTVNSAAFAGSVNRLGIGALVDSSPNQECYGDVAHPAVWSVALSTAELEMLMLGHVSPLRVRPQALVFYDPCFGRSSTEIDIIGARAITVTGTTASKEEPPLKWAVGQP